MRIRNLYEKFKKSIWLYPVFYSLFAVFLALGVILLDGKVYIDATPYIPVVFLTSTDLAKSVLSIVASSFITIMTFTFSTTMVVLTMYTSEFSPRVVENFLEEKSTMKAFGVFVSGFLYAIISLLFMREVIQDYQIIAGSIGVLYILVGIINFIVFIHKVGTYTQASNLIDRLYQQARKEMVFYKEEIKDLPVVKNEVLENFDAKILIKSPGSGFIQGVDYQGLFSLAKESNAKLFFTKVPGQFVTEEDVLVRIFYDRHSNLPEDLPERIQGKISVGLRRTEFQDFGFTIQKLVEVALKALSPGVNDPNTAIFCIQDLGLLLRDMADLENGYVMLTEEGTKGILYREGYDLNLVLTDTFHQIIHYGREDLYVMLSVVKAHGHILEKATAHHKEVVLAHMDYVEAILSKGKYEEMDRKLFQREIQEIRRKAEK